MVFADAGVAPIQAAVARGEAAVFINAACETELIRVLGYPLSGRNLNVQAQAAALAQCRALARDVRDCATPHVIDALPRCADADDQMFLELARDCHADALLTKDGDLLALASRKVKPLPFCICTPRSICSRAGSWAGRLPNT